MGTDTIIGLLGLLAAVVTIFLKGQSSGRDKERAAQIVRQTEQDKENRAFVAALDKDETLRVAQLAKAEREAERLANEKVVEARGADPSPEDAAERLKRSLRAFIGE